MRWSNILLWVFFLNKKSANQTKNPLKNLRKEVLSQVSFSSVILIPETLCVWVMVIPSLLHCKHFCLLFFFFPLFSFSLPITSGFSSSVHTHKIHCAFYLLQNWKPEQKATENSVSVYTHTHTYIHSLRPFPCVLPPGRKDQYYHAYLGGEIPKLF